MAIESSPSKMRYVTLLRRTGLAPAEYLLLMTIWTYSDEKLGSAYPSVKQLAEDTGLSERYVKTLRKKLEDQGFLILKSRGGRRQGKPEASEYRLALPRKNAPQMGEPQITPSEEMGDPQIPSRVNHRSEMGEPQITPSDPDQIIDQIHPPSVTAAPHPPSPESQSGEGFEEWINLFPSSKRRNLTEARSLYTDTIESGVSAAALSRATRAYLDHEKQNEGGKYIGQAVAVLEHRRWEKHRVWDPRTDGWGNNSQPVQDPAWRLNLFERRARKAEAQGNNDEGQRLRHEMVQLANQLGAQRNEWGIGWVIPKRPQTKKPEWLKYV